MPSLSDVGHVKRSKYVIVFANGSTKLRVIAIIKAIADLVLSSCSALSCQRCGREERHEFAVGRFGCGGPDFPEFH